jgi:hypothetical protein
MTTNEVEIMLKYLMTMYPSAKFSEQQFQTTLSIWIKEFKDEKRDEVVKALRNARLESPDWMPSLSRIQKALQLIKSSISLKSPEMEFKDTHCGKTVDEWRALTTWLNSQEGEKKIESYRQRFNNLFGGSK